MYSDYIPVLNYSKIYAYGNAGLTYTTSMVRGIGSKLSMEMIAQGSSYLMGAVIVGVAISVVYTYNKNRDSNDNFVSYVRKGLWKGYSQIKVFNGVCSDVGKALVYTTSVTVGVSSWLATKGIVITATSLAGGGILAGCAFAGYAIYTHQQPPVQAPIEDGAAPENNNHFLKRLANNENFQNAICVVCLAGYCIPAISAFTYAAALSMVITKVLFSDEKKKEEVRPADVPARAARPASSIFMSRHHRLHHRNNAGRMRAPTSNNGANRRHGISYRPQ